MAYAHIKVVNEAGETVRCYGGNNRECREQFDKFVRTYGHDCTIYRYKTRNKKILQQHTPKRKRKRK